MRLLHCTQKLLKELGSPPLLTASTHADTNDLGNWYANIFRMNRRKCILFTNEKTLYCFLVPKTTKESVKNIVDMFLFNLKMNLQAEDFPLDVINSLMQEYTDIGIAKTANRHVLGSMNELTFQFEFLIANRHGGIENVRILGVNKEVNRTIMRGIRYLHPIESLRELLLGQRSRSHSLGD